MNKEIEFATYGFSREINELVREAVLAERQACAAIAERFADFDKHAITDGAMTAIGEHTERLARAIAATIRARGKGE